MILHFLEVWAALAAAFLVGGGAGWLAFRWIDRTDYAFEQRDLSEAAGRLLDRFSRRGPDRGRQAVSEAVPALPDVLIRAEEEPVAGEPEPAEPPVAARDLLANRVQSSWRAAEWTAARRGRAGEDRPPSPTEEEGPPVPAVQSGPAEIPERVPIPPQRAVAVRAAVPASLPVPVHRLPGDILDELDRDWPFESSALPERGVPDDAWDQRGVVARIEPPRPAVEVVGIAPVAVPPVVDDIWHLEDDELLGPAPAEGVAAAGPSEDPLGRLAAELAAANADALTEATPEVAAEKPAPAGELAADLVAPATEALPAVPAPGADSGMAAEDAVEPIPPAPNAAAEAASARGDEAATAGRSTVTETTVVADQRAGEGGEPEGPAVLVAATAGEAEAAGVDAAGAAKEEGSHAGTSAPAPTPTEEPSAEPPTATAIGDAAAPAPELREAGGAANPATAEAMPPGVPAGLSPAAPEPDAAAPHPPDRQSPEDAQPRMSAADGSNGPAADASASAPTPPTEASRPDEAKAESGAGADAAAERPPEAEMAAAGLRPPAEPRPPSGGDDLRRVRGIGRGNEAKLRGLGIHRLAQIAAWTQDEQRWIGGHLGAAGRVEREDWVGQARRLVGTSEEPAKSG